MEKIKISVGWWKKQADKKVVIGIGFLHLLAIGSFFPHFFSWSGLVLFFLLYWISGGLGITLCFHRLLTHKSFKTPKWLRFVLTSFGCLALQGSPFDWVGTHRLHHIHSDKEDDPHSPLHGFSWAHIIWVLTKQDTYKLKRYVKDLESEPMMHFFERFWLWPQIILTMILFLSGWVFDSIQMGLSWVMWGVGLRTVLVFHATWFVNSATHTWGYRNFKDTRDNSKNLWWVALGAFGEGWHNNHHGAPNSAAHGMKWFEFDPTYWTIRLMEKIGLAANVRKPPNLSALK